MERLDNILKSVATSCTKVSVESAMMLPNGDTKAGTIKQEPLTVEITSKSVKARARSVSGPSRKPSLPSVTQPSWEHDGGGGGHNGANPEAEEDRRKQRRERNKEAAARCRKRRLDLTCTLQVLDSHFSMWE